MAFAITNPGNKEVLLSVLQEIQLEANEPVFFWSVTCPSGLSMGLNEYTGFLQIQPKKTGVYTIEITAGGQTISFKLTVVALKWKRRPAANPFLWYTTLSTGAQKIFDFTGEGLTPETLEEHEMCEIQDQESNMLESGI